MRGKADTQVMMLKFVTADQADQLLPEDHPIWGIKRIVDNALRELAPTFSRMYSETGRPSIRPWAKNQQKKWQRLNRKESIICFSATC